MPDSVTKPMFGGSDSTQSNNSSGISAGQNQNYGFGINGNYGVNESQSYNQGQSSSQGGSQSSGQSNSQGTSFSQSEDNVYGAQDPYLQDVYAQGQNAFNQGMAGVNGMTPAVQAQMAGALGMGNAAYGNQAMGGNQAGLQGQSMSQGMFGNGIQQGMVGQGQTQNMMGNGATQQLLNSYGDNPYLNSMKGQIAEDANMLKQQNLGSLDSRAAAAGMSGSSGYRDQVNDMSESVDKNALNQMTQLGYQSQQQAMADKMAMAQNTDNFNLNAGNSANQYNAQMAAGADQTNMAAANAADQYNMGIAQGMDANQQAAMANMLNMQQGGMNMFNPFMVGQQMAANYASTIGGPTVLGSSMAGSQNTANSSNQSSSYNTSQSTNSGGSFSNGMNVGLGMNGNLGFGNNYGANAGSGYGNTNTHTGIVPGLAAAKTAGF
jgi:hypothetical protein